jgi:iron-sulfur cluster repair protein YtfE (RIC family)
MNQSINEFLTDDHHRLDELLEAFQEWKPKDLAKGNEFLAQFVSALHRHLQWEETILFPLYEQKTGQTALIRTLLGEHQEIREWLEALSGKVGQQDTDSGYEEKMLVEELGGHNAREEYALYPELDKLLADEEKKQVFEAMARLQDAVP